MWKHRSILDSFTPREHFIPNHFAVLCSHHSVDTLQEHQLTIDNGILAVNDHNGVPVTRISYFDTRTGELATTLLLSEWDDLGLFSQAFKQCLESRATAPGPGPCLLNTPQQTPIVSRIPGTSDFIRFGSDGVATALRGYAGADSIGGRVSLCSSSDHTCLPTACYTPMSTLRLANG